MSVEFKTHARMQCQLNNLFWQFQESMNKPNGDLSISKLSGYRGFGKPLAITFSIGDTVAILTDENEICYAKVKEITLKKSCFLRHSPLNSDELTATVNWYYSYPDDLPLLNHKISIELFNQTVGENAYCLTNHSQTLTVSSIDSTVDNLAVIGTITFPPVKKQKKHI